MTTRNHATLLALAAVTVVTASCALLPPGKQPDVFLWTAGDFRNTTATDTFYDASRGPELFLVLSYCGQAQDNPELPPLNVLSNVQLRIAGRPKAFAIDTRCDANRRHIGVTLPMRELDWVPHAPFKVEWRVADRTSNTLIADLRNASVESTTLYPTTPRPRELWNVEKITYADYHLWTENKDMVLDGQTLISFYFNGNGDKPWSLSAWSHCYDYAVRGKEVTLDTGWSLSGYVSNGDVLLLWRQLQGLVSEMPSWRDGPTTRTGQKWEWSYYTDPNGKRVYTPRDKEYYKVASKMEHPVWIEFHHARNGIESQCELSVKRDSKEWQAITDIFLRYCHSRENDPALEKKVSRFVTQGDDQPCVDVTLKELLAHPSKYDGKRVRVTGYHHAEEIEHSSLSAGPEGVWKYEESVWLGGMSSFAKPEDVVPHNDSFISVEGTFVAGHGGHLGLWPGEIGRLTRIEKQGTQPGAPANAAEPRR